MSSDTQAPSKEQISLVDQLTELARIAYNQPFNVQGNIDYVDARRAVFAAMSPTHEPLSGDALLKKLEGQCQAIWRTSFTIVCALPKGHDGDHRADCGYTFNGEVDVRASQPPPAVPLQEQCSKWPDIVAGIRLLFADQPEGHKGCAEVALAAAAEIERLRGSQPPPDALHRLRVAFDHFVSTNAGLSDLMAVVDNVCGPGPTKAPEYRCPHVGCGIAVPHKHLVSGPHSSQGE